MIVPFSRIDVLRVASLTFGGPTEYEQNVGDKGENIPLLKDQSNVLQVWTLVDGYFFVSCH